MSRPPPEYFSNIEKWTDIVHEEFIEYGPRLQFERDAMLWRKTLANPGIQERGDILRRIFAILRWGGLMIRPDESSTWRPWSSTGWPIAAATSHGGRVMIQLPDVPQDFPEDHDHSFWCWLITGQPTGDLRRFVSTSTTGDDAERENKLIFKRLGATHGIDYGKCNDSLPLGRRKVLLETKPIGINLRNTKVFRSEQTVLTHHRHWGMNIPLGGHGNSSLAGQTISANGEHGHIYIYYMSPAKKRCGGLLIGFEGSEYGKWDQVGHRHNLKADSSMLSPTFGYKWHHKTKAGAPEKPSLSKVINGPAKYNSMLVDLTTSGWRFIVEEKMRLWMDDMVCQTSCADTDSIKTESPSPSPSPAPSTAAAQGAKLSGVSAATPMYNASNVRKLRENTAPPRVAALRSGQQQQQQQQQQHDKTSSPKDEPEAASAGTVLYESDEISDEETEV